jgi:hypothetical protein
MRLLAFLCALCAACAHAPPAEDGKPAGERPPAMSFDADTIPPVRKRCRADAPQLGPRDRASGRLILDYLVTESGRVRDVSVSGDATAGAVKAIRAYLATCTYQPAMQNGKPVAVKWKGELTYPKAP